MFKTLKKYAIFIHILLISVLALLEVYLIIKNNNIFGAKVDWFSQNVPFAEYFRNLFYNTKNIFPNLALHIGAGQNIFNFAYYGLFNPYIIITYLLPMLRIGDYFIFLSIFNIIVTSVGFYIFLIKNNYSKSLSFFTSLLIVFSTSFIFNSYNYILFVTYFPFLILALWGVKKYFDNEKSYLLVLSITLISLCNFYFLIPCLLCIILYALYYYFNNIENKSIKENLIILIKFLLRIFLGILIASFLLLPVFYVIISNRTTGFYNITLNSFLPNFNINQYMFKEFGLGLSFISIIALIYNIVYIKKGNRFLSIIIIIIFSIPIFNALLNGLLYIHNKVLMPFIPLVLILIIDMLKNIKEKKHSILPIIIISLILLLLLKLNRLIYIDFLITSMALFIYKRFQNNTFPFIMMLITIMIISVNHNIAKYIEFSKEDYSLMYDSIDNEIYNKIDENDKIFRLENAAVSNYLINYSNAENIFLPSVYSSTSNSYYSNAFFNIFNNNAYNKNVLTLKQDGNILFQKYMGVKYLLTDNNVPYGYTKVKEDGKHCLYKNENVNSIAFISNHILNYNEYNNLNFIEKIFAYNNNVITDNLSNNENLDIYYEVLLLENDFSINEKENISIIKDGEEFSIESKDNGKIILSLKEPLIDDFLIIRFKPNKIEKINSDLSITINGIKNIISEPTRKYFNNNTTFDYVISSNDVINELDIDFIEGLYQLSDIEIYRINKKYIDINDNIQVNIENTKNISDTIIGNVNVENDGYCVFTIPYDSGFKAYIDNNEVEIEMVNECFIGFKITSGEHEIKLVYEAPYSNLGKILSIISIIILLILLIFERKTNKKGT